MMTIFQKHIQTSGPLMQFAVFLVLLGCEVKPFDVVAPDFEAREGSAVISAIVPNFSRGLIQRVELKITSADTSRLRTVTRNMNFPIP